jgi:hypothetical protein
MEDFSSGLSHDATGSQHGSRAIVDSSEWWNADDPLGDEAAFPTTWQHLALGDASRD